MPTLEHHGASIYYEEFGKGFPILTFAPAGLSSTIAVWSQPSAPINPTTEFATNYRVIALDQRNAGGKSRAPITAKDGWHSYTADHIALLDHLRIDHCHLYGQCIGGSFIMSLLKAQPQRIASAVLAQPIGRVGPMKPGRAARFDAWAKDLKDHPEATEPVLDAFHQNLYADGFLYIVWTARSCRAAKRRAWCWRATMRRIRTRFPRRRRSCSPTRSSSRSGRRARRWQQRGRVSKNFSRSTRSSRHSQ
jgi:pimeloyl-ACP methyl ester carboxylesterase